MTENTPPPADDSLGEPVLELQSLREEPETALHERIRRGILRRVAGVHFLEFAVETFASFLREIGDLFFGGNSPRRSR